MPEGDTIFRAARTLSRALTGRTITRFDTELSPLAVVARRAPIAGRTVDAVSARGKHLLMDFSGDLVLRTHMRMHGSWHIYRQGTGLSLWETQGTVPARRTRRSPLSFPQGQTRPPARIVITTADWIAIAFRVSEAEFLSGRDDERHSRLAALGPDLLAGNVDLVEARARIRATPARHIADALLRQQSVAGLGNVYKSELLFLCGTHPLTPIAAVSDAVLDGLLTSARALITLNVREESIAGADRFGRTTTGRLNPREKLWVYDRAGKPCFKCGSPISSASETEGRRTYWCPACQPKESSWQRRCRT